MVIGLVNGHILFTIYPNIYRLLIPITIGACAPSRVYVRLILVSVLLWEVRGGLSTRLLDWFFFTFVDKKKTHKTRFCCSCFSPIGIQSVNHRIQVNLPSLLHEPNTALRLEQQNRKTEKTSLMSASPLTPLRGEGN